MLKREITYENFNGEKVTDVFLFNINKTELIELESEYPGGMGGMISRIVDTKDYKDLVAQFKRLILMAYGEKSEDGKRFIKNDQLREDFSQHAAFNELFVEFATNEDAAVEFFKGVLPKDLAEQYEKAAKDAPSLPAIGNTQPSA